MADTANLELYQGDDEVWTVTVLLDDGTPADITGYTARAQIRRAVADADPEVATELTCTVQSPEILLSITHDQSTLLSGRYVWDLQLTTDEGAIKTVLAGNVTVKAEVTRVAAA